MKELGLTTLYILLPLGIVIFSETAKIIKQVRPIILCYIVGILIGNSGLLPAGSRQVLDTISTATVALSIPLMLFSLDLTQWRELTGKAGLSMFFAFIAILISSTLCFLLFRGIVEEGAKMAGLVVGVYTGGTPNMAAIQRALQINSETYLAVHTADVAVGGIYLLILMTFGKRVFRAILPAYRDNYTARTEIETLSLQSMKQMVKQRAFPSILKSFGLAVLVVALGAGASLLIPGEASTVVAILGITTIAIALSFIPRVRKLAYSFQTGEYIILIFCTVVGSMADFSLLVNILPTILGYVTVAVLISITIHVLLCRIFSVDADTMIITSTSAIFSPPFVSAVAVAIGNRNIIFAGITTGIIGYAAGNYLGVLLANLLRLL